ncbi:MAG: sigma-70 family RNA polymerase sigma factor [Melioribacteraceae bacterium]|nr:sigma-70 family RNA polymerase sigma factor [Melioribacteraceae bacterium]
MITETKYNFLVQQYKDRVYSYSLFMMKNRMDADDVAQEVLIRIWKNINKFNMLAAKTWIMKTTHNLCIDYLRRRKSDSENNPYSIEDVQDFIENKEEENPVVNLENKITEIQVEEAIRTLPENLRSVFVLYEIYKMKYREIGKTLDIPINSVKVNLFRARKQLQSQLSEIKFQEAI